MKHFNDGLEPMIGKRIRIVYDRDLMTLQEGDELIVESVTEEKFISGGDPVPVIYAHDRFESYLLEHHEYVVLLK